MLQLKKQTKFLPQKQVTGSTPAHRVSLAAEEELPVKRSELGRILQQFAGKEEELLCVISELQGKNRELRSLAAVQQTSRHEFERCRHLLSIKEQLIIAQQREIQQLKTSIQKMQLRQGQGRDLQNKNSAFYSNVPNEQDLNELSKIESIDEQGSSEKENRGFETKRKICLKKSVKSIKNNLTFKTAKGESLAQEGHKLEIARLRAEVSRLQTTVEGLKAQLQIAEIEMDHLSRDCDVTGRRERKLHDTFIRFLRKQECRKGEQESVLSQKCEILERYIDKLTEKVEKIDQSQVQLHPPPFRKFQDIPPPITPHFSNSAVFVFPITRRTPTKLQSPPPDQIFQACCEQDLSDRE